MNLYRHIRIPAACAGMAVLLLGMSCKDEQELYSYDEADVTAASTAPEQQAGMGELPAGHPPLDGMEQQQLPEGHPPLFDQNQLPAGHPPIMGGEAEAMDLDFEEPPADRPVLDENTPTQALNMTGIKIVLPAEWESVQPDSQMRLAQFQIPGSGDSQAADFVVFHFGPGQGGDAVSNVTRWLGQINVDEDFEPQTYQQQVGQLKATEVYAEGTLAPSGRGGPAEPQQGSALYGLIIEGGPQGSLFIKVTGGAETVQDSIPAFVNLINQLEAAPQ